MNECNEVNTVLDSLRASAAVVSTPEVTVNLDDYQKILDGIATHNNVVLRQKKSIEEQLVVSRRESVDLLEKSMQFVEQLRARLRTMEQDFADRQTIQADVLRIMNRRNELQYEEIVALQKQLRAAKRGSRK